MDPAQESVVKSANSTGTPQRLVYCVHGRANDCCVSVLNDHNNADAVSTIIRESYSIFLVYTLDYIHRYSEI